MWEQKILEVVMKITKKIYISVKLRKRLRNLIQRADDKNQVLIRKNNFCSTPKCTNIVFSIHIGGID